MISIITQIHALFHLITQTKSDSWRMWLLVDYFLVSDNSSRSLDAPAEYYLVPMNHQELRLTKICLISTLRNKPSNSNIHHTKSILNNFSVVKCLFTLFNEVGVFKLYIDDIIRCTTYFKYDEFWEW